jgi:hypothetical protein
VWLAEALRVTVEAERALVEALLEVSRRHASEPDIRETTDLLAKWSRDHAQALAIERARLDQKPPGLGWRVPRASFGASARAGVGLLRDLHQLTACVAFVEACWTILLQAALASHNLELEETCRTCGAETVRQRAWLDTKLSQVAPQALTVPVPPLRRREARPLSAAAPRRARSGARVLADRRRVGLIQDRYQGLRGQTRTAGLRDP